MKSLTLSFNFSFIFINIFDIESKFNYAYVHLLSSKYTMSIYKPISNDFLKLLSIIDVFAKLQM